jgi:hypothetical protein
VYKFCELRNTAVRQQSNAPGRAKDEFPEGEPRGPEDGLMTVTFSDGATWKYPDFYHRPNQDATRPTVHHATGPIATLDGAKIFVKMKNNKPKGKHNQRLVCVMKSWMEGKKVKEVQMTQINSILFPSEEDAIEWSKTVVDAFVNGAIMRKEEAEIMKREKKTALEKYENTASSAARSSAAKSDDGDLDREMPDDSDSDSDNGKTYDDPKSMEGGPEKKKRRILAKASGRDFNLTSWSEVKVESGRG